MSKVVNLAKRFVAETDGPTATEYAMMLALIVMVAVVAVSSLGTKVSQIFSALDGTLTVPGAS